MPRMEYPTNEFRWFVRTVKMPPECKDVVERVLQQKWVNNPRREEETGRYSEWRDVPEIEGG